MGDTSATEHLPSLPGYRLTRRIGRGGFSVVYEAVQLSLDRLVAVKVLLLDLGSPGDVRRFDRERLSLSRLGDHRHIVDVVDAGISPGGRAFLVMRLYRGGSLEQLLVERGPLPVDQVVRIMADVSDALEFAHGEGVLHRDIAPKNVLLTEDGEPALADFGIASIAGPNDGASTTFLTPAHSAPEVLRDERHSVASDVYALASTAYTLLMGGPPFGGGRQRAFIPLESTAPRVDRDDVPAHVRDAIAAGLAPQEHERPSSAAAFARLLRGELATGPLPSPPHPPQPPREAPVAEPPREARAVTPAERPLEAPPVPDVVAWPRPEAAAGAAERTEVGRRAAPPADVTRKRPVAPPITAPAPTPTPSPAAPSPAAPSPSPPTPAPAVRAPAPTPAVRAPAPTPAVRAPAPAPAVRAPLPAPAPERRAQPLAEPELPRSPYVAGLLAISREDAAEGADEAPDGAPGPGADRSATAPADGDERSAWRLRFGRRRAR